jgi:hypothetical protein
MEADMRKGILKYILSSLFTVNIIFFALFGLFIRDSLSPKVTVVKPFIMELSDGQLSYNTVYEECIASSETGEEYIFTVILKNDSGEDAYYTERQSATDFPRVNIDGVGILILPRAENDYFVVVNPNDDLYDGCRVVIKEKIYYQ